MRDRTLSLTLAFLIPILFTLAMPYSLSDLSIWITLGNYFLKTGTLLRHDIFSVLPTTELVYPAFGSSVFYSVLYQVIGLMGVCIFHAVVVLPIILFISYRPLIRDKLLPGSKRTKWVLFLFWLGAVSTFAERPAMLALIPLVLSFQIIAGLKEETIKTRDTLKLIALEIVWANLHGSFILLPLMLIWKLCWSVRTPSTNWKWVFPLLCAACINPFGFKVYPYLLETARLSRERGISEWDFPSLGTFFPTCLLFWLMFSYVVYYLVTAYREGRFRESFSNPFFLFILLGTTSVRNAALCFVVLLPGAHALGFFRNQDETHEVSAPLNASKSKRLINLCVASLAILAIPLIVDFKPKKWDGDAAFALTAAIKKDGRLCPIFNDWELGGFLILELPNPIYLDTRNIIFSQNDFIRYQETLRGEGDWHSMLEDHHACFAILSPKTSAGLIAKLTASNQWRFMAFDGHHVLYSKNELP